ncbi:MAG: hypothetical protein WAX69_00750 [Victivallales bacterium]
MKEVSIRSFFLFGMAAAALSFCISCQTPDWKDAPPGKEELGQFPVEKELPGVPPESGIRYWKTPFKEIYAVNACYNAVRITKDSKGGTVYELWNNSWEGDEAEKHQIIVSRGPSLDKLGEPLTVCDGTIINDFPDMKNPPTPSPNRGFSRFSTILHDKEYGYVIMCCACADYLPGSTSLFPVILVSKTGEPGTFKYLGKIKGEPAELNAAKKIWCDGGTLMRMENGKWRMYLNGFGTMLSAIESDTLEGNWKFLRNEKGDIRELISDFPSTDSRKGCFHQVLKVADGNWHMWMTDKWPPQTIWHSWSADGLSWKLYGQQPEITRKAFNYHGIKCIRVFLSEDGKDLIGLLSIYKDDVGWILQESRMPSGPPQP